ncbi:MAG: putative TIM-barrel fold metal-dependent hydrolase [Nonlabens sp.]|jgi:predicted TIM-barrel fold metal-dependent hydrolase
MQPFPEGLVVGLSDYPMSDAQVPQFLARAGVPGIVDIHVHFMPDRLQQAVWRYFDALVDPPWPVAYTGDADTRLGQLRELGVVAHTALAYAHQPGMLAWLNDHTLDLADAHPQVIPTFTLYPEDGVTQAAADALARGGVVCKIHDQLSGFRLDDPRLDGAWRLLSDARTLVVAHTSKVYGVDGGAATSGPDQIYAVRARHPALRLCIAHLGLPDPDGGHWDAIQSLDDVWTDPSSTLTEPPPTVAMGMQMDYQQLRARLGEKVLFGSDFPSIAHPYAHQVRGMAHLALNPAGLREVLHDRAARLLAEAGYRLPTAR